MSWNHLTRTLALSIALVAGAGTASAASGSVTFDLDTLPMANGADEPRTPGTVGYWLPNTYGTAHALTYSKGGPPYRYGEQWRDPATAYGPPFGDASVSFDPLPGQQGGVHATLAPGHVSVGYQTETAVDQISASALWYRSFALDPFASLTFSGRASVLNPQQVAPVLGFSTDATWPERYSNSGTVRYSAPGDLDVGLLIQAQIFNDNPLDAGDPSQGRTPHADDFSYSIDSFGVLSLAVHNRSADTLFGNFELMAFAEIVPPPAVPEPATAAMMALGALTLVVGRRRRDGSLQRTMALSRW